MINLPKTFGDHNDTTVVLIIYLPCHVTVIVSGVDEEASFFADER